jgi:hypothetical protein
VRLGKYEDEAAGHVGEYARAGNIWQPRTAPPGAGAPAPRAWSTVPTLQRNTRERIIETAQPLLEPGEAVAHVARALEGPNRWVAMGAALAVGVGLSFFVGLLAILGMWLVFTRLYARRVLLATDRDLVIMGCGRWRFTPKVVLDRFDLETRIGPLKGLWLETRLGGRRLYVVARSATEVARADADLDA